MCRFGMEIIMGSIITHWELPFTGGDKGIWWKDEFQELSYDGCMRRAVAIALRLQNQRIKGKAIGVCASHKVDTLILFLGILLSGNYYVPVSDEMPEDMFEKIKEQVDMAAYYSSCELTEEEIAAVTEEDYRVLYEALYEVSEDAPLYVVFTSGSTGTPKGIIKSHRSMIAFVEAYQKEFAWAREDILGNQTPFYFDASAKDFYLSLFVKCKIVILDKTLFSRPLDLVEKMNEEKITGIQWVPSALAMVSLLGVLEKKIPQYLRRVCFVGESFPTKQLMRWMTALPDTEFVNLYGFSELAGICAFCRIDKKEFMETEQIPIGLPLSNCQMILVDDEGNVVSEKGEKGEIHISSTSLADAYLAKEDEQKEAFYYRDENRFYRSGDQAMYDEFGRFVFAGRSDFQIKHMGHRIELEAIENEALSFSGVKQACCLYHKNKIVLFVSGMEDKAELTTYLKQKLPPYMIPNRFQVVDEIPLNANGKKDRKKLEEILSERRGRRNGRNERNYTGNVAGTA